MDPDVSSKRLRTTERALDGSRRSSIEALKCDDLDSFMADLDTNRNERMRRTLTDHKSICEAIDELRRSISSRDKLKNADVFLYERQVNNLCDTIFNLKNHLQNQYGSVRDEEFCLEEEVKHFERFWTNLDTANFYKSLNDDLNTIRTTRSFEKSSTLNKDILNFQEFLFHNGGHTGGWGEQEHKIFSKFVRKFHRTTNMKDEDILEDDFFKQLQIRLPDKSIDDILSHLKWMKKYNYLKDKKAQVINKWKLSKTSYGAPISMPKISSEKRDNFKNVLEFYQKSKSELNEWKSKKNLERKLSLQDEAGKVIAKIEDERLKEVIRRKHKMSKATRENLPDNNIKENDSEKSNIKYIMAKIKEFQTRDREMINSRKELVKKIKSINVINVPIAKKKSDQSTNNIYGKNILKFTEQWNRRIAKSCTDIDRNKNAIKSVDDIPKLRTPNWCRGVTYIR